MSVVLETTLGNLTVDLYCDERPITCDPTGTGRGGESIYAQLYGEQAKFFEMEKKPNIRHRKRGTLSMVNNTHDQHGAQFFITLTASLDSLDGIHTVFGEVVDGWNTLDKLNLAVVDRDYRPYHDIRILHTVIIDNPFPLPVTLDRPARSPSPTIERIQSTMIPFDEMIDEDKIQGKTDEEIKDYIAEKEAQARAQILELIGDLPEADMKPPENVLFICKLNPITTDEDLETIFSRFGEILSCEIVRDKQTGDSLCYAFIEYETEEEAEQAYFKMDNVLIDDRRIHVDFSQSVAKTKWEYEQKQKRLKTRPPPPPLPPPKRPREEERRHHHHHSRHHRDGPRRQRRSRSRS